MATHVPPQSGDEMARHALPTFLRPIRSITKANIFEIEVNFNRISPEWE